MDERLASGLGADGLRPVVPLKSKFAGVKEWPTPTFLEAIQPIHEDGGVPDVLDFSQITYEQARDAKLYGDLQDDPVDIEGIAALMKWTSADSTPPFHKVLTERCYNRDRRIIEPFAQFVVLLLRAMLSIEPFQPEMVFRGVKGNVSQGYVKDREFTWHAPSSCTKSIETLQDPLFCGQTGQRTIFAIRLTHGQARDISRYSILPHEDEVLLPPGCRFKVLGVLRQGDLSIVQVEEIPSKELILDLSVAGTASTSSAAAPAADALAAAVARAAAAEQAAAAAEARAQEALARAQRAEAQAQAAQAAQHVAASSSGTQAIAVQPIMQAAFPPHQPPGPQGLITFVGMNNGLEQIRPGHLKRTGEGGGYATAVSSESIPVSDGRGLRSQPCQRNRNFALGLGSQSSPPADLAGIEYAVNLGSAGTYGVWINGVKRISGDIDRALNVVELRVRGTGVEFWIDAELKHTEPLHGQGMLFAMADFLNTGAEASEICWL